MFNFLAASTDIMPVSGLKYEANQKLLFLKWLLGISSKTNLISLDLLAYIMSIIIIVDIIYF